MTFKAAPFAVSALVLALSVPVGGARAEDTPAYTLKDVTACSGDAMRLCRDKLPDIGKIQECMKANYANLRPKCKARFDRLQQ